MAIALPFVDTAGLNRIGTTVDSDLAKFCSQVFNRVPDYFQETASRQHLLEAMFSVEGYWKMQ
jgi:hypothetical protein